MNAPINLRQIADSLAGRKPLLIPLHSAGADASLELHIRMRSINPQDFRQHKTGKYKNQARNHTKTRVEVLAERAYGVAL